MANNFNEFFKDTNKKIESMQKEQISEAKKIVAGVYSEIVDISPSDTGLFRHNHFLTVNSTTSKTTGDEFDSSMISVIDGANENIDKCKFNHNDTITIQNNLKYADALEAGHSQQAKNGVYGITEEKARVEISKNKTVG